MKNHINQLLQTAKAEINYAEKADNDQLDSKTANIGSGNWTKYARDMDEFCAYNSKKNGYPWCDVFVDWCFVQAFGFNTAMKMLNQPVGGNGAGCSASAKYFLNCGRLYKSDPQMGDQIFFLNSKGTICHTGIVIKVKNGRVYTIEGNTSSSSGIVDNGGEVCEKSYPLSYNKIYGYGRPDWSLAEEDENMNAERFSELFAEMRQEMQDNDCHSYSADAREWATTNGIVVGNGTTESGEPNYMWSDFLSREQLVTVLYRFAQLIGKA